MNGSKIIKLSSWFIIDVAFDRFDSVTLKYSPILRPISLVIQFMLSGIELEIFWFPVFNSPVPSLIILLYKSIYSLVHFQSIASRGGYFGHMVPLVSGHIVPLSTSDVKV